VPRQQCHCGARFTFPETAVGKRAKCPRCGAVLSLEADEASGPIRIAGESEQSEVPARPTEPREDGHPRPMPTGPIVGPPLIENSPPGYAGAMLRALLFLRTPHNILTFLMVVGCLFLAGAVFQPLTRMALPCFFLVPWLIVVGWFAAFQLKTIVEAAAGETDLPSLALADGAMEGIVLPLLRWVGSWLLVLAPFFIAAVALAATGRLPPAIDLEDVFSYGLSGLVAGRGWRCSACSPGRWWFCAWRSAGSRRSTARI
jgi:hypothetical protein